MTSLRVALKLSMAEVKPDEKKRKNPLLNDKVVEEPTLDDVLSGRKRKSSFEIKDGRNRLYGKDKSSRSSNGPRSSSPAEESLTGRSEGSGYVLDNASLVSEDLRRGYFHEDYESIASVKADDISIAEDGQSDRPGSSNSILIEKNFEKESSTAVADVVSEIQVPEISGKRNDPDAEGDGDGDDDNEDDVNATSGDKAPKKRRKRTSSILKSLEPINSDEPPIVFNEEDSNIPRYQSHRAAAMVAKTKLSARPSGRSGSLDDTGGPSVQPEAAEPAAVREKNANISRRRKSGAAATAPKLNWVQCNKCTKWRTVAAHVNDRELPEEWYCHMNTWDAQFSTCDAAEEVESTSTAAAAKTKLNQVSGEEPGADGQDSKNQQRIWVKAGNGGRGRWRRPGDGDGRDSFGGDGNDGDGVEDGDGEGQAPEEPVLGVQSRRRSSQGAGKQVEVTASVSPRAASTAGAAVQRQSSGSVLPTAPTTTAAAGVVPAAVNWVQCNKCRKWRKVPETIDVDSLPEKWFCSLNTWSPPFARCAAKQEPDDPVVPVVGVDGGATATGMKGANRARRQQSGGASNASSNALSGIASPILPPGTIKKVSWVQCERRNCKKWRKVPGNIDVDLLPEKWYCEMNTWDTDSATCDAPEASDSENEQPSAAASRQQLILANSKGANALSYRRIIFGNDGRIRVCFSDKNKNGYGIFSYSEAHKPSNDADDYMAPTRRVGYWWSGAYDESAGAAAAQAYTAGAAGSRTSSKKIAAAAAAAAMSESGDTLSMAVPLRAEIPAPTYLLDTARRMCGMVGKPASLSWPKKISKSWSLLAKMPLFRRQALECTVVMSSFMSTPSSQLGFTKLLSLIGTCRFADPEVDACREYMSSEGLKGVVKRLEDKGLVEVSYTSSGQLCVDILTPVAQLAQNCAVRGALSASAATGISPAWTKQGLPLKLRKFHAGGKYKQDYMAVEPGNSNKTIAAVPTSSTVVSMAESRKVDADQLKVMTSLASVSVSSPYPAKPFRLQHKEKWSIPVVGSHE